MSLKQWLRQRLPEDSRAGHRLRRLRARLHPKGVQRWQHEVLNGFAASQARVQFVQVGSNDAGYGDPLRYHTLHNGWRGLMIEPMPHVYQRLTARYKDIPGLEFANVAIDKQPGERPFYHLRPSDEPDLPPWYDMLGSFIKENVLAHARYLPDLPERVMTTTVRCATVDEVCAEHGINSFDVLNIDAEGYDYQILKSIDLSRYRPAVVLYENRHLPAEEYQASLDFLHTAGYLSHSDPSDTLGVRADLLESNSPLTSIWRAMRQSQNLALLAAHSGERWPESQR